MILRAKGMVFAVGRLTKEPITKFVGESKRKVVKLGVAVSEKGENPDYVNGDCWGEKANYAEGLKKGDEVFIVGLEKTRTYTAQDGSQKKATDTEIKFISKQPIVLFERGAATEHDGFNPIGNDDTSAEEKPPWEE